MTNAPSRPVMSPKLAQQEGPRVGGPNSCGVESQAPDPAQERLGIDRSHCCMTVRLEVSLPRPAPLKTGSGTTAQQCNAQQTARYEAIGYDRIEDKKIPHSTRPQKQNQRPSVTSGKGQPASPRATPSSTIYHTADDATAPNLMPSAILTPENTRYPSCCRVRRES